jgi:hypothetical protein
MNDQARTHRLMTDVGPLLALEAVIEAEDGGAWLLVLEADDAISVELDDNAGRLVLSADLGAPAPEGRLQLYEMMLVYNTQWEGSGGVRMGLDQLGGRCVQMLELPLEDLDTQKLVSVLEGFLEVRLGWMQVVGDIDASSGDGEPKAPPVPPSGMRV